MNNERDAHNALIETAQAASTDAIRDEADPLENTVVLPVTDRRYRSREARVMVFDEMPTRFRDAGLRPDELYRIDIAPLTEADKAARRSPAITLIYRDFRDGQREHTLTVHEINQQDGFSGDEKL